MEVPKLDKSDMYKFLMYTLLQNNFTILSTETIAEIGADISTHNTQFIYLLPIHFTTLQANKLTLLSKK